MESPSRNPLLLDQNNEVDSSSDESSNDDSGIGARVNERGRVVETTPKEAFRRSPSTPTDRYNFAYIAFYILGM